MRATSTTRHDPRCSGSGFTFTGMVYTDVIVLPGIGGLVETNAAAFTNRPLA